MRRRKPWNRAFSVASLKDFEPMVARRTQQLVDLLSSKKGEVNLSKWFSWFTYVLVLFNSAETRCSRDVRDRYDLMSDMA